MNEPYEYHLDAVNDRRLGVRATFRRTGDRYAHSLFVVRGDRVEPVVASVENADDAGWPLSPPVQEIREVAAQDGGRTLLLIGAAAHGHWSAGVRAFRHPVAGHFIEFDVAVRLSQAPSHLGAAYDVLEGARWMDSPSSQTYASRDDADLAITASLDDAVAASMRPSALLRPAAVRGAPNRRTFCPDFSQLTEFPTTFRWKYWIGLARA